jgi:hypothetical protein
MTLAALCKTATGSASHEVDVRGLGLRSGRDRDGYDAQRVSARVPMRLAQAKSHKGTLMG